MGNCLTKSKKTPKAIENNNVFSQKKENIENPPPITVETEEQKHKETIKLNKKTPKNIKNSKKKKNLDIQGGLPAKQELEAVQEIIKHKKTLLRKKNLELEEIKIHKKLFLKDMDALKSPSDKGELENSVDKLEERIQKIVENNIEVTKTLENVNQELEAYSVGVRRGGSAKSEEIRESVRKALSKMANFDKDIERIQNSTTFNPEISISPLKIPKSISKVITTSELTQGYTDTPLLQLRKILEEKNNEMDERKNAMEKMKSGQVENNEEVKKYKAIIQKELEQIQLSDLDRIYLMHSDVVLGFDEAQKKKPEKK